MIYKVNPYTTVDFLKKHEDVKRIPVCATSVNIFHYKGYTLVVEDSSSEIHIENSDPKATKDWSKLAKILRDSK